MDARPDLSAEQSSQAIRGLGKNETGWFGNRPLEIFGLIVSLCYNFCLLKGLVALERIKMQSFLVPFVTICMAEIGDKTQLALFCLATRTRQRLALFLGALLAFALSNGFAILLGGLVGRVIPLVYVKLLAGIMFIGFGILTMLRVPEEEVECELKEPFLTGFTMILVSEAGDKTQIATALFAATYDPFLVFLGMLSALSILSLLAIYLGQSILTRVEPRKRTYLAGSLFVLIGLWQFIQILQGKWR